MGQAASHSSMLPAASRRWNQIGVRFSSRGISEQAPLERQNRSNVKSWLGRAMRCWEDARDVWRSHARKAARRCRKLRLGAAVGDASDVLVRQIVRIK